MIKYQRIDATYQMKFSRTRIHFELMDKVQPSTIESWLHRLEWELLKVVSNPSEWFLSYFVAMDVMEVQEEIK